MARDARLGLAQNGHELGDGQLGVGQQRQKAQARDLASGLQRIEGHGERGGELVHSDLPR
jgi:hypothetical protein